jgi:hypothetical protein
VGRGTCTNNFGWLLERAPSSSPRRGRELDHRESRTYVERSPKQGPRSAKQDWFGPVFKYVMNGLAVERHEDLTAAKAFSLWLATSELGKPGLPPWGPHVRFRRVQTLVGRAVRWSSCAILSWIVCWSNGLTVRSSTGPDDPIILERDAELHYLVQSAAIVQRNGEGRGDGC